MKRQIVENWLTNIGELSFTVPFCQLLVSTGHQVIHISSQGPMEQGKDVIAVGPDGRVKCYQLKSGNLTQSTWAEIKTEIDELVELPPVHPSLNPSVGDWDAYLVTNGRIANPLTRTISDYSRIKKEKGHQELQTITGPQLVSKFVSAFGDFMPTEAVDFQKFLEIYNEDGPNTLDAAKFKYFWEAYFRKQSTQTTARKVESIRASLVLCSYLLTYRQACGNHIDNIRALALLLASVYEFASREKIRDQKWRATEDLIYTAIERECGNLVDDVLSDSHNLVATQYGILSEAVAHKVRCSELVGYLSAYGTYRFLRTGRRADQPLVDAIVKADRTLALLGEVNVPLHFNHLVFIALNGAHDDVVGRLASLLVELLKAHVGDTSRGLPTPYYDTLTCLKWALGAERLNETFGKRSFTIRCLVLFAAALGARDLIEALWREISYVQYSEAIPDEPIDYLRWRFEHGHQQDRFPHRTQSWSDLQEEARTIANSSVPLILADRPHFLPFFLNTMPHRFSPRFAMGLLEAIRPRSSSK